MFPESCVAKQVNLQVASSAGKNMVEGPINLKKYVTYLNSKNGFIQE